VTYSGPTQTPAEDDRRAALLRRPRSPQWLTSRKLLPPAVIALVALAGAGCANSPAATSPAATIPAAGAASVSQGVKFAQCMRSNGVGNFPDPGPSGQFTIDAIANGSGVDTSSASFQQALSACRALEPAGFTGTTRSAQQQDAALKFAQCVRANGVPDFPDPTPDGPLIDTNRIPSANTPGGRSALQSAMQQCSNFSASAGVTGGQ
jgi:hypothetical protein